MVSVHGRDVWVRPMLGACFVRPFVIVTKNSVTYFAPNKLRILSLYACNMPQIIDSLGIEK